MSLKTTLLKYAQFYYIYQKAKNNASHTDAIANACKELILDDADIDMLQTFYYLNLTQKERTWQSGMCFSYGEVVALKTHYTHRRHTVKGYLLELDAPIEAEIVEISLQEILEDEEQLTRLVRRMSYIVPFDENEILQMPEDYSLMTLWNFDHYGEAEFLFYNGSEFLHSTHKDARISSSMDYGYSTVIDEEGKYGIIHNKTVLLSGDSEFEWTLPCEYYYINIEGGLAEVQREESKRSDDFRDYLCEIIDLETKQVYANNALVNSLEYDNFMVVTEEGLLQYVKVDREKRTIEASSPSYRYIVTPIHYAPKPVQDDTSKQWGYIDKACREIIAPQYDDWHFFNDGYTVVKKEGKDVAIDEEGNVVIPPHYQSIEHYQDAYFFVQNDAGEWAVFEKNEIYIDFIDISQIKSLPKHHNFPYDDYHEVTYDIVLKLAIKEKKRALQGQRYTLPLKEYIQLFGTLTSHGDLEESGLWWHPVKVKKIPEQYEDIIKKEDFYIIGWSYPTSAGMFDMTIELPVMFTKADGGSLGLGIALEDLELVS